jgi:GTP-binding protein
MFTVAIIGRTNVGKSTLFNALLGFQRAIVEDSPRVTRDRTLCRVNREGLSFDLVDTGGIVDEELGELDELVAAQVELAILEANLVLAVVDGVAGVTPLDYELAALLRRHSAKVIWVVNKCEKEETVHQVGEFYALGGSDLIPVSAAHRRGISQLFNMIDDHIKSYKEKHGGSEEENEEPEKRPQITCALIGRPNVGKSSLANRIFGQERVIVSPHPGTTRDSIDIDVSASGTNFQLIDTAGLRKKARVESGTVERYSTLKTLKSIARSDVAILVIDGSSCPRDVLEVISDQEMTVAKLVHDRGKGLVIVINKWDAVEKDHRTVKNFTDSIRQGLPFANYAEILFVSATTGRRCPSILAAVKRAYDSINHRVRTSDVNRLLMGAFNDKPPPTYHGEPVKLMFATQAQVAPPTFVLFLNNVTKVRSSYERYLERMVRENTSFTGSPIRFVFKKRTSKSEVPIEEKIEDAKESINC